MGITGAIVKAGTTVTSLSCCTKSWSTCYLASCYVIRCYLLLLGYLQPKAS